MLINPFEKNNMNSINIKEIDLNKIQKYLVDNFMTSLINEEKEVIKSKITQYLYDNYSLSNEEHIKNITSTILDKIFGYGILQSYIENEDVTDIRIVKFNSIFIKLKGKWIKEEITFKDENEFIEYIRYVALKNGKIINFDTPLIVFSDRKNNLRIEAGILPVNVVSPSLVIRIHRNDKEKDLSTLMKEYQMFNENEYKFLIKAIEERKNMVISGKGGSGKTTLLRAIIKELPNEMAISTNEETAELNIMNKNVIQREVVTSRNYNSDINLDLLTRHSLVSSNDAIIIGELKGSEASVFFDSISTGHLGYATVHSDSAENTIDRLVTLIKRDVTCQQYKEEFIQKLLSKSIDYIIFMKEFKIDEIIKVCYLRKSVKYKKIEMECDDI